MRQRHGAPITARVYLPRELWWVQLHGCVCMRACASVRACRRGEGWKVVGYSVKQDVATKLGEELAKTQAKLHSEHETPAARSEVRGGDAVPPPPAFSP